MCTVRGRGRCERGRIPSPFEEEKHADVDMVTEAVM
jgi:hypothetical protein